MIINNRLLWSYLRHSLCRQPEPCTVLISNHEDENIVSAANLWQLSLQKSHLWRSQGVQTGDVILDPSQGIERLTGLLAALNHQCIYVPLAPNDSPPTLPLHPRTSWLVDMTGVKKTEIYFSTPHWKAHKFFYLAIPTSGSTRLEPRFLFHDEDNLLFQLKHHQQYFMAKPSAFRLCLLPTHHIFGLILDQLLGLVSQQNLILAEGLIRHPKALFQVFETYEIEYLATVPRMLKWLVDQANLDPSLQKRFKAITIHVGGALLEEGLRHNAQSIFHRCIDGYGLTECGPGVMMDQQLMGCEIRLRPFLDRHELLVKTPSLAKNLLHDVDEFGFFPTKDIVVQTDHFFTVLGRSEDFHKGTDGEWHLFSWFLTQAELVLKNPHHSNRSLIRSKNGDIVFMTDDHNQDRVTLITQKLEKLLGKKPSIRPLITDPNHQNSKDYLTTATKKLDNSGSSNF